MNKIVKKISAVVQIVLLAPVKLPGKALNIIKYIALGLGVLEAMTGEGSEIPKQVRNKGDEDHGVGESVPNSLRNGGAEVLDEGGGREADDGEDIPAQVWDKNEREP